MIPQDKATYFAPSPGDVLLYQLQRIVTNLFKAHLATLENIAVDHDEAMAKLEKALPQDYRSLVELADYLTPAKSDRLRKLTLDAGNDSWREISKLFTYYNIQSK